MKKIPVIWIRSPKTGGTSIKWALLNGNGRVTSEIKNNPDIFNKKRDGVFISYTPSYDKIVPIENGLILDFKKKHPLFFEKAWKFTIIRNPWDKFISSWKYCLSTKKKSIKDLLLNLPKKEENYHDWFHLTMNQTEIILDKHNNVLVDKLLKFETLQKDFYELCNILGLPKINLPYLRLTKHKEYQKYFDKETKKLFYKKYKKDITFFDYEF